MSLYDAFIRQGGAKGLPRSLNRFLQVLVGEAPDSDAPLRQYFTYTVLYDAAALAAPTVLEVCVAPYDLEVVRVDSIVEVAVNADTAVALKIEGGSAIDTLQTGTTKGTVDTYEPTTPDEIDAGEQLTATSDGTCATGTVLICATLRTRAA